MDKQDIIDGLDVILGRRGEKITQGDLLIVEAAIMALAPARPQERLIGSEALKLAEEWKGRGDDCGRLARAMLALPEARTQLGLFIIVLFKKKEDRRVVLSVYAPDLEAAKHMAIGRYMGEWIVERAIAKADPTVFRVHDDAWYENESEPPMNIGPEKHG